MPSILKTQQRYKRIYHDLINGYSSFEHEGETAFVKHVSEYDLGALELSAEQHHEDARKKGLLNEEEKLSLIIENGLWEQEKEDEISNIKVKLADLSESHKKLFLKKQLKINQKNIDEAQQQLGSIVQERDELIGLTCEKYAERKSNEEIVYHCFYKDKGLTERCFTKEEFEDLHHVKLYEYIKQYNSISSNFSYLEMKKLAALPFFSNMFFMVEDDPTKFYGKSIVELTVCQIEVFNISKLYKSVMQQGHSPTEDLYEDIDSVVSFFDSYTTSDTKALKEAGSKDSQSIVGATIEEMKTMTKGSEGNESVTTLSKALDKVKDEGKDISNLSMEEIAKMHGY